MDSVNHDGGTSKDLAIWAFEKKVLVIKLEKNVSFPMILERKDEGKIWYDDIQN